MKKHHIVGYKQKKRPFGGFKIYKIYYVGNDKEHLQMRTIFRDLTYEEAEQKMYELENKIHK